MNICSGTLFIFHNSFLIHLSCNVANENDFLVCLNMWVEIPNLLFSQVLLEIYKPVNK